MLFQDILTQRIIIVLIIQIWPIFYGSYFTYKLLKRAKNRSTFTLSSFFILISLAYFFATLSVFSINTNFSYFFYITGIFCFVFGHCIYIIFSWVLVNLEEKPPLRSMLLIAVFYVFISSYVFWVGIFFHGIKYDSSTFWVPTYTWFFLITSWIVFFIVLVLPQLYFSSKLFKIFEGVTLRHRINMYLFSAFLELGVLFFLFLYNTLVDNQTFRIIYLFTVPETSTIAAYLMYKSFGKNL